MSFTDMPTAVIPEWNDNENARPHIPKALKPMMDNHEYLPPTGPQAPGRYVRKPYVHQEYPKMLFHPKFGSEAEPYKDDFKNDREFTVAYRSWQRGPTNRTKVVNSAKDEERFIKKGWVLKRPDVPVAIAQQDPDEI